MNAMTRAAAMLGGLLALVCSTTLLAQTPDVRYFRLRHIRLPQFQIEGLIAQAASHPHLDGIEKRPAPPVSLVRFEPHRLAGCAHPARRRPRAMDIRSPRRSCLRAA